MSASNDYRHKAAICHLAAEGLVDPAKRVPMLVLCGVDRSEININMQAVELGKGLLATFVLPRFHRADAEVEPPLRSVPLF
jgi:hypothetical protein